MLVQIDIEACTDVVARLRAVADEAEDHQWRVRAAAVHARCSTSALAGVPGAVAQVRDLADDLARRVDLAIEIDTARARGPHDPVVTFEVPGETEDASAIARLLGQTLATELAAWRAGEEELARLSATLERHAADPDVVAGLLSWLGPTGVEDLTTRVLTGWSWDSTALDLTQPDRGSYRAAFARAMGCALATGVMAPAEARLPGVDDLAATWLGLLGRDDDGAAGARALLGSVDTGHHDALLVATPSAATLLMRPHTVDARFASLARAAGDGPGVIAVAKVRAAYAALTPAERALLVATEPWLIGNLDGVPFADRITTNRIAVRAALVDAQDRVVLWAGSGRPEVAGSEADSELATAREDVTRYRQLLEGHSTVTGSRGEPLLIGERQIVLFDPAGGRFAEVVGTLGSTTKAVGVLVGGTGSNVSLKSLDGQYVRARELADWNGGRLALITYLGGPMPQSIPQAADASYANANAAGLRDFAAGIDHPAGVSVTVAGHSYGGSVVGAAEREGMVVDRVLHIESAGAGPGVASSADYAAPDTPRYSMTAPDDFINLVQGAGVPQPVHGADPDLVDGVVQVETGWLDDAHRENRQISGFIASHSNVFMRGSTAWLNIGNVMTGGQVTLNSEPQLRLMGEGSAARYTWMDPVQDPAFEPPTAVVR